MAIVVDLGPYNSPIRRVLGPYNMKARMQYFMTLKFSQSQSSRALKVSTLDGINKCKKKRRYEHPIKGFLFFIYQHLVHWSTNSVTTAQKNNNEFS